MPIVIETTAAAAGQSGKTFLQLVQRVRQECGIAGDGPSTVLNQTGIYGKLVNWVLAAHEEIQLKHTTWRFDWAQLSAVLAAQESHEPTVDLGVSARQWDFDGAYCYTTASGEASRQPLVYLPYADYRDLRIGASSGQPQFVTEAPNKELMFTPTPTGAQTVVLEYWKKPEVLAANSDIPRMPQAYHMAIVWRAVMFYCGHDESMQLYQEAKRNYERLISRMEETELERLEFAEPMA